MQALGWAVLFGVLAMLAAAGAVWWAWRERRRRVTAEEDLVGLSRRVDTAARRVEQLEGDLVRTNKALLAAERQAREERERARVATLSDQAVADQLVAGLAARRAASGGCHGGDAATCATQSDLRGLGARHAPAGSGASIPAPPVPAGAGVRDGTGGGRSPGGAAP